ncbi:cytochrome c biogenesis CcdA family protein [Streptomyces sp. TP-A0874]|uniref:cytochrome c biogenesis CcdA family protein n=1 Tax=Streptomyces sp. TP-A0874 TaxID=549819 RepID=UPI000852CE9E|nr:cytochrome c biogenesis protein CcdA [Streptomyces sp. TP-A0874]
MNDVGYLLALLGGLLTLLSPCSALLLPAFFAYTFTTPTRLLRHTGLFYVGLCATLVPLGAAGSVASRFFNGHRELLVGLGGWTMIVLGLAQILGLGFGSRRLQQAAARPRPGSVASVLALGAVYGLAGFCAGPILGGILTVAALGGGSPWYGGSLLAVYALGMALPLFLLALLWDRLDLGRRGWLRGRQLTLGRVSFHSTSLFGGLLFIALGALFLLFDGASAIPSPLSADSEFAVEQWLSRTAAAIPDRMLLLTAALLVAAGALVVLLRNLRHGDNGPPAEENEH